MRNASIVHTRARQCSCEDAPACCRPLLLPWFSPAFTMASPLQDVMSPSDSTSKPSLGRRYHLALADGIALLPLLSLLAAARAATAAAAAPAAARRLALALLLRRGLAAVQGLRTSIGMCMVVGRD